jgi:N-methylhydantoinase B
MFDPIRLEVFKHQFSSIAEEMGVILRKASYSPNIKERRDYSCALFDGLGNMISQAAHIPVHLGSMPLSVSSVIEHYDQFPSGTGNNPNEKRLNPGDSIILNDPFLGGTHLPDITIVTPVHIEDLNSRSGYKLVAFVASRAHHADVGGMTPGSMPISREIYQEGLIIPPLKIIKNGTINNEIMELILANVRTPQEREGDLRAQIAANNRGSLRMQELIYRYSIDEVSNYMEELIAYTERMTRKLINELPDGEYVFIDWLDNDGLSNDKIKINTKIIISGDEVVVDFSGSAQQQKGSINAVYAITLSAVYYVFRSLLAIDVPNNSGCLKPIRVIAPLGTVINAHHPSAVAGGNVETSQRIVDVLLGALAEAIPDRIPAASQGTMNNITIGGWNDKQNQPFTYYETIGGGNGARPTEAGPSAMHSHMTNTLNTPIEAIEFAYPLRVLRYEIRRGSGGSGQTRGGDGIRRDIQSLVDSQASLLTERRSTSPYSLSGGNNGESGENILIKKKKEIQLPGKGTISLDAGDIISIRTPGGGGYGKEKTG